MGSVFLVTRANRMSLSIAQVPMWVADMYRMLAKSNASNAPRSERSSSAFSRASRSSRRRSNWMRSSQSTAFVPNVAVVSMSAAFSRGRGGRSWADHDHSAFGGDDLAGDVVRVGRGQEQRGRHDVLGLRGAAQQDAGRHRVEAGVPGSDALQVRVELGPQRGGDNARGEGVHGDLVGRQGPCRRL